MEFIKNILFDPWPWYISGPLLGLIVPLLLLIGNKSFGVSRFYQNTIASCNIFPNVKYFQKDWKADLWNFMFLLGIFLSGFIFVFLLKIEPGDLSNSFKSYLQEKSISNTGFFPNSYFVSKITNLEIMLLAVGGFFVGFGSRYAQGCTAGHAITGLSKLNLGSLIAVIGFFIGGLLSTYLILDQIL